MKHDFRVSAGGEDADRFRAWLQGETIDGLRRAYGDGDAARGAIFLFVNRAYEAHMADAEIGSLFGVCLVRAEWREEDEEPAFAMLESFGAIARGVHGSSTG